LLAAFLVHVLSALAVRAARERWRLGLTLTLLLTFALDLDLLCWARCSPWWAGVDAMGGGGMAAA
jgi:hypothetical protein